MAAHVSLALVLAAQDGSIGGTAADPAVSGHAFTARLIKAAISARVAEIKSDAAPPAHGNSKEKLQAPLMKPAPGTGLVPGHHLFSMAPLSPHYFQIDELTEKPLVLQDVSPVLTLGLPDATSQTVVLRLLINEQGEVDQVLVESDNLALPVQDLVKAAFGKLLFESGKIDNIPVKTQLMIEVNLEATDAQ